MQNTYKILPKLTPSLFAYFVSKGNWKFTAHLKIIEKHLFSCMRDANKFLIVTLPPRHGKSEFISKYFPLWFLLNFPDKRVILASYQASLAESWSRRIREQIVRFGQLFGLKLNPANRKAGNFGFLNHSGGISAVGVGGALTGQGADLLIIDDPIKNDAEANSSLQRDKLWDWFNATALTRLEPDGICILVMTRWHEDDLAGRLLKDNTKNGDKWKLLNLPAIAEDNDLLCRSKGEALWEKRFSKEKLLEIKQALGSYWFSALYQQNPVPSGHSIFKREDFRYFEEFSNYYNLQISPHLTKKVLKNDIQVFAVADLALSTKETADFTVVIIFGKLKTGEIILLNIVRERFESTEHLKLFTSLYAKYHPLLIGIENVQFQQTIIQQAIQAGLPVKPLKADKDKISRALPIAALLENGKVFFRRNANYLEDFETELLQFPKSKHDDQVDAFAYIFQIISGNTGLLPI